MARVLSYLKENLAASALPDVFWLELPFDILTPEQKEHEKCSPHRVAVVAEEDSVRLEFLVRPIDSLRCSCTGFATSGQREFLMAFFDRMIKDLELTT
jgi:hypothetical protein